MKTMKKKENSHVGRMPSCKSKSPTSVQRGPNEAIHHIRITYCNIHKAVTVLRAPILPTSFCLEPRGHPTVLSHKVK